MLRTLFSLSSTIILIVVGFAKIVSAFGHMGILNESDPIFGVSFRLLMLLVGCVEIAIAFFCFFLRGNRTSMFLVAWLSSSFMIYQLGLRFVGWHRPCPCLGNLTDALHIPPQTADVAIKIILAYLLIGSYATLFWIWRQHERQNEEY
jgi:hypothetical protein